MENKDISLPPFYVGQKIVRIADGDDYGVCKKGNIYTVGDIMRCGKCGSWKVYCIEFPPYPGVDHFAHCSCGFHWPPQSRFYGKATKFAPVEENFIAISFSRVVEEESKLVGVN